jgi:alanine racemase
LKCVVRLCGRIIQVREVRSGQSIGYGATYRLKRRSRVATVSVGYADGYLRKLGGADNRKGAEVYIGGQSVPVIGRISMDLITIDVTDIPEETACRGEFVELIGPHVNIDHLGERAETISYEILTRLGRRIERHYI